jgi:membrane dipeptidase
MIVDAHLDMAYTALAYKRDLTKTVAQLRDEEAGRKVGDGLITATFPSLLDGGVGLIFGTMFVAPYSKQREGQELVYRQPAEAHRHAMRQLDYYHRLADSLDYLRLVGDQESLAEVVSSHQEGETPLLGIVPLMEGADPIAGPEALEEWVERGLRIVGLAWDDTRYAGGAWQNTQLGITPAGYALLEAMTDYNLILDITHMSEKASLEALERYEGRVVATHSNPRQLIPMNRHLSDTQIHRLAERKGVMGVVLYNRFLKPGLTMSDPKESVTLDVVVAHIDYVCQLLGTAENVGIGSDFDGGFGAQHIPAEIDSVHDLHKIGSALREKGYAPADVRGIMGGNWLRLLEETW